MNIKAKINTIFVFSLFFSLPSAPASGAVRCTVSLKSRTVEYLEPVNQCFGTCYMEGSVRAVEQLFLSKNELKDYRVDRAMVVYEHFIGKATRLLSLIQLDPKNLQKNIHLIDYRDPLSGGSVRDVLQNMKSFGIPVHRSHSYSHAQYQRQIEKADNEMGKIFDRFDKDVYWLEQSLAKRLKNRLREVDREYKSILEQEYIDFMKSTPEISEGTHRYSLESVNDFVGYELAFVAIEITEQKQKSRKKVKREQSLEKLSRLLESYEQEFYSKVGELVKPYLLQAIGLAEGYIKQANTTERLKGVFDFTEEYVFGNTKSKEAGQPPKSGIFRYTETSSI